MPIFDQNWIDHVEELLARSPLRQTPSGGRSFPESVSFPPVEEIRDRLAALRDRVAKPLSLAVLGEVKAGKSTLVNALVAAEVAPVDVLEATQWVMEIKYAPRPWALIRFVDGSTQEGSPEEIRDLLFTHRHNLGFVNRCVEVVVGLPLTTLTRWHLIDTPGLATVTEHAAARTRRHLSQVDAVLWVLNANHLGQVDVAAELADVARMGKPIIAVINRIDEVDTDSGRLVRYVNMRFAEYVQGVFPVSALQARQAQLSGDEGLLKVSGLPHLQAYLQERITSRAEEAQSESLGQQLLALIQLEETVHETYGRQLEFLLQESEAHFHRLELERQRIQKEAEHYIETELERYLYGVAHEFASRIPDSPGWPAILRGSRPSISEEELQNALTGEGFRAWTEKLGLKVDEFIRDKWRETADQMEVELRERFQAFYSGEARRLEGIEGLGGPSDLMQGLKEGLTTGGVIGTGLAVYAAALGPAAAYVTMGAALGAFLPPSLLIGAAAGLVLRWLHSGRQAERLRTSLRDAIVRYKQQLRADWLSATVFPTLYRHNAAVADSLHRAFVDRLCQGWMPEDLRMLAQGVTAHARACRTLRERFTSSLRQDTA